MTSAGIILLVIYIVGVILTMGLMITVTNAGQYISGQPKPTNLIKKWIYNQATVLSDPGLTREARHKQTDCEMGWIIAICVWPIALVCIALLGVLYVLDLIFKTPMSFCAKLMAYWITK